MKWTLFFSSLLALSIALSGCVAYNPYGPYAFYGYGQQQYGQQYGKNPDFNLNGAYAFNGYGAGACAPMVCEPVCDPCAMPMTQQPMNYAYSAACDPCATPGVATATSISWLARIMRGAQYPCNGCGDEVYWGDYGRTPDDVCNPCTYDGKWAGNTDRTSRNYDPCGNCGDCNVCQQGTSFRNPAIGTYMNRLYAPVFQDKIAPTHATTPLDYGLRDPGLLCADPCVDPCVEPCAAPYVCETGSSNSQQIVNNQATRQQVPQQQVPQQQVPQPLLANQYAMNPVPARNVPTAPVPANDTLRSFLARTFAKPQTPYPNYQPVYTQAAYTPNPALARQAPAQQQLPAQQTANTTIRNSAPNAVCQSQQCQSQQCRNHQTPAQANPKQNQIRNAVHHNDGTTLSTALPVSHLTPQAIAR